MKQLSIILALLSLPLVGRLVSTYTYAGEPVEWGYYNGDRTNLYVTGVQNQTKYNVAIKIPGDGALEGAKITGLRIPIYQKSSITKINGWIATKLAVTMKYVVQQSITWKDLPDGYQKSPDKLYYDLTFEEPYEIPSTGCYVGYQFEVNSSSCTPLILDYQNYNADGAFVTQQGYWDTTVGKTLGVSVMKAMVEVKNMSNVAASFEKLNNIVTVADREYNFDYTVISNGDEAVTNIEYTVDVNGQKDTRTANVSINAGLQQTGIVNVNIKAPKEAKYYDVKMNITKVNGKDNSEIETVTVSEYKNLGREVERNTLVEEFTGTSCPNCPRGITGMEQLKETYGDRFVGVAIHQYSNKDVMYLQNYRVHNMTAAPKALIDGKVQLDPYYGSSGAVRGILNDFKTYMNIDAHAEVALQAYWTSSKKDSVKVIAKVEGMTDGYYSIAYALTVDGLHGTTTEWAQQNNFYNISPLDSYLAVWCSGGKYAQALCYPEFNDVLIASSYNIYNQNTASELGNLTYGVAKSNEYTMPLPSATDRASLRSQVDANNDKIYAVAIVFDRDGKIAQAKKVNVQDVIPVSIESLDTRNMITPGVIYNLAGQIVDESYKGIVIVNGKKMIRK